MKVVSTIKALVQATEGILSATRAPQKTIFAETAVSELLPRVNSLLRSQNVHTSAAVDLKPFISGHGFHEDELREAGNGTLTHKALLVDAAGTLLEPTEPVTQVYLEMGRKYGVDFSERELLDRYRRAYAQPWCQSILRYVDDARPFWQHIITETTGCSDPRYSEEVYKYYTSAAAWRVTDPNAEAAFAALRRAGLKLAVVSNFDTRLRPVMQALGCDHWFDVLTISAEVHAEKPNPCIFYAACEGLGVEPREAVHVGDDRRNDVWGARDAGCDAWLWGGEVHSFQEVAERIGVRVE